MIRRIADLQQMKEAYLEKMGQYTHLCMVCYGTGCMSSGCKNVRDAMVEELEKAAELLLEDYDTLKKSDGYLYDLADILKQVLSNSSQKYHREMVSAYRSGDLAKFNEASDQFLSLIDKVEEVLGTRKEFLFGTWTEQAKKLAEGDDDFTKDIYELNAKSLVTTWASYPQAESGGLKDYSNRQWAGLTQDFYPQRWTMWINQKKAELKGESTQNINWFAFEWAFARSHTEYTTEASGKNKTNGCIRQKLKKTRGRYPEKLQFQRSGSKWCKRLHRKSDCNSRFGRDKPGERCSSQCPGWKFRYNLAYQLHQCSRYGFLQETLSDLHTGRSSQTWRTPLSAKTGRRS